LCERFVVPELLQEDATPENLSQALLNLVNDNNAVEQLKQTFTELHLSLRQNTAQKAAAAILSYLPNG
jgi:lipid-A-disaccharide synthase